MYHCSHLLKLVPHTSQQLVKKVQFIFLILVNLIYFYPPESVPGTWHYSILRIAPPSDMCYCGRTQSVAAVTLRQHCIGRLNLMPCRIGTHLFRRRICPPSGPGPGFNLNSSRRQEMDHFFQITKEVTAITKLESAVRSAVTLNLRPSATPSPPRQSLEVTECPARRRPDCASDRAWGWKSKRV